MLSNISEISENRYREAKQSHLAVVYLLSKSREIRILNPAPLQPRKGQNVGGIRRPQTDD